MRRSINAEVDQLRRSILRRSINAEVDQCGAGQSERQENGARAYGGRDIPVALTHELPLGPRGLTQPGGGLFVARRSRSSCVHRPNKSRQPSA
jgi:hypothetical protein